MRPYLTFALLFVLCLGAAAPAANVPAAVAPPLTPLALSSSADFEASRTPDVRLELKPVFAPYDAHPFVSEFYPAPRQ